MFACLYLPRPVSSFLVRGEGGGKREEGIGKRGDLTHDPHAPYVPHVSHAALVQVARDFSPRVETHGDRTVTLDISGLGSLIGEPRSIGEELRRTAADAGLHVHVAVAATSTAAVLLAHGRAGLTVVPRGEEAQALVPLPLSLLDQLALEPHEPFVSELKRWGLRTLGDLAALPSADLSARLGQGGLRWQRWARGEDARPLVPAGAAETFEASLDLEWPVEGLEPLSFVMARLFEPLCERLERQDRGVVTLHVTLKLVTRELHQRSVELPAPMRDPRVLRTLALLDLESNPPPAAIDRVTIAVDVTDGRILQFGLFARALPAEKLATLMARLGALMGSDRIGAPSLVDTHRPGAFAMAKFAPSPISNPQSPIPGAQSLIPDAKGAPPSVLRRFRSPIPARVTLERGRPVRVITDRRGFSGGRVERCEGPWRSSGDWWVQGYAAHAPHAWNCDEWDVVLSEGSTYRISQARGDGETWSIDGIVD